MIKWEANFPFRDLTLISKRYFGPLRKDPGISELPDLWIFLEYE